MATTDKLAEICARKREHISACKLLCPETELLTRAQAAEPPRGFVNHLRTMVASSKPAIIAEIKKASPSKGLIRADFDPAILARAYAQGGAACLSVLTDEPYFQGHDDYLVQARRATHLPCLRKDFMLESYQVLEARALGADCILLIMAALSDEQAIKLEADAMALGMDVLIEVHDMDELERALTHLKSPLIGVNNRSLKTLKVDLATSEQLSARIPSDKLKVCESGIAMHADITRMQQSGFHVFLVGESLMRQPDVTYATQQLIGSV